MNELLQMVRENPVCLPLPQVAELLGMNPGTLRASIEQGRCPFGFSWKLGERSGFKIPTITFWAWYTKGLPPDSLVL